MPKHDWAALLQHKGPVLIYTTYRQYRRTTHHNVTHRRRQNFYALPSEQWQTLSRPPFQFLETLGKVDNAIDENAEIAEAIMYVGLRTLGLPEDPVRGSENDWHGCAKPGDIAKAQSTIRQFHRDWSEEGLSERRQCFEMIFEDLRIHTHVFDGNTRVLVPGAGLGRLQLELCRRGYNVEGNEISYHQLLASNWILNHIEPGRQFSLYPFATQFTNLRSRTDQLRKILIPDIHPTKAMQDPVQLDLGVGEMNMSAADFVVLYGSPEQTESFDAVVTLFFIDTAPNLFRYVQTVYNCLRSGGVWINVGPLLWHFDDNSPGKYGEENEDMETEEEDKGIGEPGSFELSNDEVLELVKSHGFDILQHEVLTEGMGYLQNPESMYQNLYHVARWCARKT